MPCRPLSMVSSALELNLAMLFLLVCQWPTFWNFSLFWTLLPALLGAFRNFPASPLLLGTLCTGFQFSNASTSRSCLLRTTASLALLLAIWWISVYPSPPWLVVAHYARFLKVFFFFLACIRPQLNPGASPMSGHLPGTAFLLSWGSSSCLFPHLGFAGGWRLYCLESTTNWLSRERLCWGNSKRRFINLSLHYITLHYITLHYIRQFDNTRGVKIWPSI